MKVYSEEIIKSIKKDQQNGLSVSDLIEKYRIPKTSVWHHIKDVDLSEEVKKQIRRRGAVALKGKRDQEVLDMYYQLVSKQVDQTRLFLLSCLYWAEGSKREFVFTNTDKEMITFFLKILRENLEVPENQLELLVRISSDKDEQLCLRYWKKVTGVKTIKFNIDDRQNKGKSKYGICRVTIKKGGNYLRLLDLLKEQMLRQY